MPGMWRVTVVPARRKGDDYALRARGPGGKDLRYPSRTHREPVRGSPEAAKGLARRWEAILNGQPGARPSTLMDLMQLRIADLAAAAKRGEKSHESVEGFTVAAKRLGPVLGHVPADQLDRPAILKARTALLQEGIGAETANTYLRRAAACWSWCLELGLVSAPWPKVKALKKPPAKKRPYTPAELEAILGWVKGWEGGRWYPIVALIADSGRRVSEVCRLKGRDVDRQEWTVRIVLKGREPLCVPVSEDVRALIPQAEPEEWLFPRKRQTRTGGGIDQASRDSVRGVIKRAVRAVGIPDPERLDTHSLRRSFVSHGTRALLPDDLIRRLTGHETAAMLRHYERATVGDDLRAAQEQVMAFRQSARARGSVSSPARPQAGDEREHNSWGYPDSNWGPRPYQEPNLPMPSPAGATVGRSEPGDETGRFSGASAGRVGPDLGTMRARVATVAASDEEAVLWMLDHPGEQDRLRRALAEILGRQPSAERLQAEG